jgi:hypothetical protein
VPKIFISYRVADEPYAAALIDDALSQHFGSDVVFRASRSIGIGDDYEKRIFEAVRSASVFLVVIGQNWLTASDDKGRRLEDPDDMVRREIIEAFEHGVRVVPVLMDAARIKRAELPPELARLAACQDVRINFRDNQRDVPALIERLERVLAEPETVTRSFLVVDIDAPNPGTDVDAAALSRALRSIVDEAMANVRVAPGKIVTEARGSGFLVIVDGAPRNLLDLGVETLISALDRHNGTAGPAVRARLRIAVHRGSVHRDGDGWTGADLVETFRLLDAPAVTDTLRRAVRAQCVVVVSEAVYHEVIAHGYGNLNPAGYVRLDGTAGWIRVPGYPKPPVDPAPAPADPPPAAPGPASVVFPPGFTAHTVIAGSTIANVDASIRLNGASADES